jgi:hypothetical protein
MKLSQHVSVAEFEHSNTAVARRLDNRMNSEQKENAVALCKTIFEPLRALRNKPINITSGFRGVALNKAIGGASSSQHCKGQAMDIKIDKEQFNFIKDNLNFDQLIWEFGTDEHPQWVHVSYDKNKAKQRGQVLRAIKVNGKTKYIPYV